MAEKISFEEALERLEDAVKKLKSSELSLEESIAVYEESVKYYELCSGFLKDAKQKIEVYRPQTGTVEDFDDQQFR